MPSCARTRVEPGTNALTGEKPGLKSGYFLQGRQFSSETGDTAGEGRWMSELKPHPAPRCEGRLGCRCRRTPTRRGRWPPSWPMHSCCRRWVLMICPVHSAWRARLRSSGGQAARGLHAAARRTLKLSAKVVNAAARSDSGDDCCTAQLRARGQGLGLNNRIWEFRNETPKWRNQHLHNRDAQVPLSDNRLSKHLRRKFARLFKRSLAIPPMLIAPASITSNPPI